MHSSEVSDELFSSIRTEVKQHHDISQFEYTLKDKIGELRLKIAQNQLNGQINQGYIRKNMMELNRGLKQIKEELEECSTSIKRIQTLAKSSINEKQKSKTEDAKSYEGLYI